MNSTLGASRPGGHDGLIQKHAAPRVLDSLLMPSFKAHIRGEDLGRAKVALDGTGIEWTSIVGGAEHAVPGDLALMVRMDAQTAGNALARVREILPADGEYIVELAD